MSQATITMDANQSGTAYTSDLSDALAAVDTCHSGATAPTLDVAAGKLWLDTSGASPVLKIYNSGWKSLFTVGSSNVDLSINNGTFASISSTTSGLGTASGSTATFSGTVTGGSLSTSGSVTAGSASLGAISGTSVTSSGSVSGTSATFSSGVDITGDELRTNQIDNYSGTNITVQAPFAMGSNGITTTGTCSFGTTTVGALTCGTITGTGNVSITGSITATSDITAYSDRRLKSDIVEIEDAVSKVEAIRGVTYKMGKSRHVGVIAQELEAVLPEAVHTDVHTGMKSVAYGNTVGLLIEAIKEQQETIRSLEERISKLEK